MTISLDSNPAATEAQRLREAWKDHLKARRVATLKALALHSLGHSQICSAVNAGTFARAWPSNVPERDRLDRTALYRVFVVNRAGKPAPTFAEYSAEERAAALEAVKDAKCVCHVSPGPEVLAKRRQAQIDAGQTRSRRKEVYRMKRDINRKLGMKLDFDKYRLQHWASQSEWDGSIFLKSAVLSEPDGVECMLKVGTERGLHAPRPATAASGFYVQWFRRRTYTSARGNVLKLWTPVAWTWTTDLDLDKLAEAVKSLWTEAKAKLARA